MRISETDIAGAGSVVRWGALEPVVSVPATDPRSEMNDQALVVASRNAFPVVAQQKSRRDNLGIASGAAIALVLGCVTFVTMSSTRSGGREPVAQSPAANALPTSRAPAGVPIATPQPQATIDPTVQQLTPQEQMMLPRDMTVPEMPRVASPVMVYDGSTVRPGAAPAAADGSADTQAPGMLALGSGTEGGAATNGAAKSTRISDPAHTVAQGTLIPAVLETAINSDVPGYVRAVVSQDVRSFDGSQILVPRSSRLIGEYKTGLAAGQKRAYLIWTRLLRPDGVSVALASPSVDFSGESGVGGRVNSHFLQRFGSAILLSVLGGASALASGGSTVVVSGGQNAASIAAQQDGPRPPTIHVRPGEPIRVFTARDLIFAPGDGKGA